MIEAKIMSVKGRRLTWKTLGKRADRIRTHKSGKSQKKHWIVRKNAWSLPNPGK